MGLIRLLRGNRDRPPTLPPLALRRVLGYCASLLLVLLNPWILAQSLLMMAGQLLALPRAVRREASPEQDAVEGYIPPFTGTWTVARGGIMPDTSHSWDILNQRYAYDFFITDERGRSHRGDGRRLEDYSCFGREILAPKDGVVVGARDGERDFPYPGTGVLDPLARDARGNYVLIRHGPREYSLLAHLQRGSIRVRPAESVRRGQVIGRCGNSGHSTEPHLHFHVQEHPGFYLAAGLPVRFDGRFLAAGERVGPLGLRVNQVPCLGMAPAGRQVEVPAGHVLEGEGIRQRLGEHARVVARPEVDALCQDPGQGCPPSPGPRPVR